MSVIVGAGDMADFIKTVASLPSEVPVPPLHVVLNGKDYCLVSPNIAILLLAMSSEDPKATAELVVQLWYSAFLPVGYFDRILEQLEPHMKHSKNSLTARLGLSQNAMLHDPVNFLRNPWTALHNRPSNAAGTSVAHDGDTAPTENKWNFGTCSLTYEPESAELPDVFDFLRSPFISGGNMKYPLRLNEYHQALPKPWHRQGQYYDIWDLVLKMTPKEWRVARKAYHEERVLLLFGHDRNGPWAKPLKYVTRMIIV
jgi:hypothetical protein